jgi:Tripartite tricarboxylate transporter family receptor
MELKHLELRKKPWFLEMSMHRFALAALFCSAVLAPSALSAQTYPSKPIHFILPYVPGGIIDTAGRNLALRLSESLGVSVVPENRPGAGGMVGADVVARSAPDGYTMLLTDPALVSNPTLQSDVPYDLFKGLQAVSIVGSSPAVIVASLTLPVKTFAEFIAYAKANPGKLNFASAGVGTAPHLAGEMIKLAAGIEMTHVPYRGIGAAYPDVMSGKVQLRSRASPAPCRSHPTTGCDRSQPRARRAARSIPMCRPSRSQACPASMSTSGSAFTRRPGCHPRCSRSSTAKSTRCCSIPS